MCRSDCVASDFKARISNRTPQVAVKASGQRKCDERQCGHAFGMDGAAISALRRRHAQGGFSNRTRQSSSPFWADHSASGAAQFYFRFAETIGRGALIPVSQQNWTVWLICSPPRHASRGARGYIDRTTIQRKALQSALLDRGTCSWPWCGRTRRPRGMDGRFDTSQRAQS